ncbi:hypothetical protein [Methylocystis hirsuta]|nr:hypothetical protein [Methylocystis hirsuta]
MPDAKRHSLLADLADPPQAREFVERKALGGWDESFPQRGSRARRLVPP